jgi:SAM-dependent methyltransferase
MRTLSRTLRILLLLLACAALPLASQAQPDTLGTGTGFLSSGPDSDVPYVPTDRTTVDSMLSVANVTPDDVVYDLGSGDGRIPIRAARTFGARGVGIEIKPNLVEEARKNAKSAGVSDRVTFLQGDLFEADISEATVVTLYLLPSVNQKLRPILFRQLEPGTRIVSHDFDMGKWEPDRTIQVDDDTIYLWTIPEEVPSFIDMDQ